MMAMYAADEYLAADDDAFGPFADDDAEVCADCGDPLCDGFECYDPDADDDDQRGSDLPTHDPAQVRAMFAGLGWSVTPPTTNQEE